MTEISSTTSYITTTSSGSPTTPSADVNVSPKTSADFAQHMQQLLQQLQDKFQTTSGQISNRIDETGRGLDELEKTISDLMAESGIEQ